jgi:hypothetical protein
LPFSDVYLGKESTSKTLGKLRIKDHVANMKREKKQNQIK